MAYQHLAAVLTKAIIVVMLMVAMPACSDSPSTPTPPTPTPTPAPTPPPMPVQLIEFVDPTTGFSTSDVRDVEGEIVRFNRTNNSLIWAADGRSFPGYPVDGNFLDSARSFQVRFGTENGERRAYFTETGPATICDIEVVGSSLAISATSVPVPGT
jgi:hypothetical protein